MLLDLEALAIDVPAGQEPGQSDVLVAATVTPAVVVVVFVLPVGREETGVGDDRARRHEDRDSPDRGDGRIGQRAPLDARPYGRPGRVVHLRGDRPLPDELVKAALFASQLTCDLRRECGSDRPQAGSPRGPPARSSPCCGTSEASAARTAAP